MGLEFSFILSCMSTQHLYGELQGFYSVFVGIKSYNTAFVVGIESYNTAFAVGVQGIHRKNAAFNRHKIDISNLQKGIQYIIHLLFVDFIHHGHRSNQIEA